MAPPFSGQPGPLVQLPNGAYAEQVVLLDASGNVVSTPADIARPTPFAVVKTDTFPGTTLDPYWTAMIPGNVSIAGNKATVVASVDGTGYWTNHIYHNLPGYDARITMTIPANSTAVSSFGPLMRRQSTGACYVLNIANSGNLNLYTISAAGTPSSIGAVSIAGTPLRTGCIVSMSVSGVSPTEIVVTVLALDGVTLLAQLNVIDSFAACQNIGGVGFVAWDTGPGIFSNIIVETRTGYETRSGLVVGFIGDSIYAGTGTSGGASTVPNQCLTALTAQTGLPATGSINATSGKTTTDWAAGSGLLATAQAAMILAGVNVVSIMLGTNDSKSTVQTPVATYLSNLNGICTQLFANIPSLQAIVLHSAISAGNSLPDFGGMSEKMIYAYADALPSICTGLNGKGILLGDAGGIGYFGVTNASLADNIHPNDTGAAVLGKLQARAIRLKMGL